MKSILVLTLCLFVGFVSCQRVKKPLGVSEGLPAKVHFTKSDYLTEVIAYDIGDTIYVSVSEWSFAGEFPDTVTATITSLLGDQEKVSLTDRISGHTPGRTKGYRGLIPSTGAAIPVHWGYHVNGAAPAYRGNETLEVSFRGDSLTLSYVPIGETQAIEACATVKSQLKRVDSYFPLAVGDKWVYSISYPRDKIDQITNIFHLPDTVTVAVIDTMQIDGRKYFLFKDYFFFHPYYPDTVAFRQEGKKIFARLEGEDRIIRDYLIYDFSQTPQGLFPSWPELWFIPLPGPQLISDRSMWLNEIAYDSYFFSSMSGSNEFSDEGFTYGIGRSQITRYFYVIVLRIIWHLKDVELQ